MPELNQESLAKSKALMKDKFPLMVRYFIEDTEMYFQTIKEGISENNIEKVKSTAHTIKSSSQLLGADKISESARKLEQASQEHINENATNLNKINILFKEMQDFYIAAEQEIRSLI